MAPKTGKTKPHKTKGEKKKKEEKGSYTILLLLPLFLPLSCLLTISYMNFFI
jgi:hypothetical protein